MSVQDLLARLQTPEVPNRYADGGDILSPQDEMQAEYEAEIAGSGGGSGLGGFFEELLYGDLDLEETAQLDLRPEFIRDMPEIPEEVEIAMSIVGPGKGKGIGKGITSLIDDAKGLKDLGGLLKRNRQIESSAPRPPAVKPRRNYDDEPMTGREFLGFPKDSRQDNMARMNELLRNPKADIIFDEQMGVPKSQIDDLARRSSRSGADTQLDRLRIKKDSLEGQLMQDRLEPRTRRRLESELRDVLRDMNFFSRGGPDKLAAGGRPGLYANINAKRKRIAAGSGERMRKPGSKGAPTAENFKQAAKTAKRAGGGHLMNTGYYGKSYR
jgi:hypothetical protein